MRFRRTDQRTNGPTDRVVYRVACTRLKRIYHKPILMCNNSGFIYPNTISVSVRQNLAERNFPWNGNGLSPGELLFTHHHELFLAELKIKFTCLFVEKN